MSVTTQTHTAGWTRDKACAVLAEVISRCEPTDAAQIMAAALQQMESDGPQHDAFGTVRRDASWWAESAPVHEVQAYVMAGLKQLGAKAIGHSARKQLLAALWTDMRAEDKSAFLRAIGAAK
jgi:hypothetical protein